MTSPFQVLGVPEWAEDDEIKKAYLRKVREYPPERAPQRFQAIRGAFELIQTRRDRIRYWLFHAEPPDVLELLGTSHQPPGTARPSLELFQRTLAQTFGGSKT